MVVTSEDSVTESNNEPLKAVAAPTKPIQVSKACAVIDDLRTGSVTEHIKHVPAKGLPKPKLASSQQAPPATAHLPMKAPDSNNPERQKLPQPKLKSELKSELKTEVAKMKVALKNAQEAFKKAQEAQKKAREDARRVKESAKKPGICDQIKALNEARPESD